MDDSKKNTLSSVENALKILDSFTFEEPEKRVTAIAKEIGVAKSTASRLLHSLLKEGFVKKDKDTQKFSLGTKLLTLYSRMILNMEVVKEAKPILEDLSAKTSESIQLGQLDKNSVVYLDYIKSTYPFQITSHIGLVNPIHCTSSGKVLLAFQDEKTIDELLKGELYKYTSFTITNPKILYKELKEIRQQGYCHTKSEFIDGITAIAAPIKDHNKNVIASISLAGPIQRINGKKVSNYIDLVVDAAAQISKSMGYEIY